MKRFLIMSVASLALLAQSAFAFTDEHVGTYKGAGKWKASDNTENTWSSELDIKKTGDGIVFKERLKVRVSEAEVMEEDMTWTAVAQENGFFDVVENGTVIGYGYCVRTTCHIQGTRDAEAFEETFMFHGRGLYRLGSGKSDQSKYAYWGALRRERKQD